MQYYFCPRCKFRMMSPRHLCPTCGYKLPRVQNTPHTSQDSAPIQKNEQSANSAKNTSTEGGFWPRILKWDFQSDNRDKSDSTHEKPALG